jgi:hypothetical protein
VSRKKKLTNTAYCSLLTDFPGPPLRLTIIVDIIGSFGEFSKVESRTGGRVAEPLRGRGGRTRLKKGG